MNKSENWIAMNTRYFKRLGCICLGFAILVGVGCKNEVDDIAPPVPQHFSPIQPVTVGHPPGLAVPAAPPTQVADLVTQYKTVPRPDVFALSPLEQNYDVRAQNEITFSRTNGGQFWPASFIPKPEPVVVDVVEPQPFRRLAGVLIGDSVMAIIDMGDGSPMQLIRPGMPIPNSPWKVKSIDQEKAVLIRNGNKLPKEIVVRLQGPSAPGAGGGGGVGGGGGGGRPNPGNPGGGANPGGGRRGKGGAGGKGGGLGGIN